MIVGSKINWILPTRAELEIEWKTENIELFWFCGYPSRPTLERYKNHFLDNIVFFSSVEDIEPKDVAGQIYLTESIEQLEKNIQHMGKDVRRIEREIYGGSPTMPLFIRENRKLRIVGGRTRTTLSLMTGKNVVGLVIEKEKMDKSFYPLRKADFLEKGWGLSVFDTRRTRKEIIRYIEGENVKTPALSFLAADDSKNTKELSNIARYLGY